MTDRTEPLTAREQVALAIYAALEASQWTSPNMVELAFEKADGFLAYSRTVKNHD